MGTKKTYCGKIGFLPYGLRHVGLKDAAPIYVQTVIDDSIFFVPSLLYPNCFEGLATS
jgi:hypothetical protein